MNDHHSPRAISIVFILLIGLTLLIGTLNAFSPVQARTSASATPTRRVSATSMAGRLPTPTPSPTPDEQAARPPLRSADTSGNIGMTILLVLIVLFGVAWGWRKPGKKKEPRPKPEKPKREKKVKSKKPFSQRGIP